MSGLDIEAIRERAQKFDDLGTELSPSNYRIIAIAARSAGDVPVLLAEVERLTTQARNAEFEVVQLRGELAAGRREHEAELREAGAEIRDAQAALADALQVIADLRGGTA